MTIRREYLVAAAALNLLQYRQIDPLLVFLLQRDVHARRQALLRASEARKSGALVWLTLVAGLIAASTGALFALLLGSRGVHIGSGAVLLLLAAYAGSAVSAAALARARGYGRGVRVASAALMASIPVAVFVLQRAGG